jgi:hypothetical protein
VAARTATVCVRADAPGPVIIGSRIIVIRVAASALRLIGRETPRHGLTITTVAICAGEPLSMISRIRRSGMVERGGQPILCAVATIARKRRREMTWRRSCSRHSVVAGITRPGRHRSMIEGGGHPTVRGVARFTVVARRQMRWMLARRGVAVVTSKTVRHDPGMIKPSGRDPALRRMTQLAVIARRKMRRILARRRTAIVTSETVGRDA